MKPMTPLLAPYKPPLKPTSPLHPENAPKHPFLTRKGDSSFTRESSNAVGGSARPDNEPTQITLSTPGPPVRRVPEGPEGTRGSGRGAGGRRQGKGGPRDRPLRAKLACGDLAGGPPPTGTHSGPAHQGRPRGGRGLRRQEHQRGHKQHHAAQHDNGWGAFRHPTRHQHQLFNGVLSLRRQRLRGADLGGSAAGQPRGDQR